LNVVVTLQEERNAQADALDVRIEQERQLISYYESRAARAEATAAAAVTAVFALAALTATPETSGGGHKLYAWLAVLFLVLACVWALGARTIAGLERTHASLFSSGSDQFDRALMELRKCDCAGLDPLDVRQRTLRLCVARATDAHEAAKAKDIAAVVASFALAAGLIAILILRLTT
jgi:hypothetical protein